jgi:sec-independent protein translocase protein TatB
MFGLGWGEMAVIAIVTLLVIPPDRLPYVMRQLGRWYGQVRRSADELRRAFVLEADRQDAAERYRQLQERRRQSQEARRRAEAETGGGAQLEAVATETEADPPTEAHEEPDEVPNDIPPDAPHPDLVGGDATAGFSSGGPTPRRTRGAV